MRLPECRGRLVLQAPGGATVYLLSPSGPKLKKMAKVWLDVVTKAGLVAGQGTDRDSRARKSFDKDVEEKLDPLSDDEIQSLAEQKGTDRSEANGSSIACILEHAGKRALLTADAHPKTLVASIKRFAKMKGEDRVRIDLCKLPHHGSRGNVTMDLIEAIARLLRSSALPPRIHFNCDTQRARNRVNTAATRGAEILLPPGATRVEVP